MKRILLFSIILFLFSDFETSAQVKVTSATLGSIEGHSIGPSVMGGRISAIDGVAKTPRILYVGAAGGGVWKTSNGGASFKSIFDKYCQSIGAIAVDQNHPDTVWVGSGESNMRNTVSVGDGLYLSTDAGDNFQKVGLDSSEHISKIIVDPKNSKNVYVAVPGHLWNDSKERGLYKTVDFGKTWQKILYVDEKTGCADIAIDPTNSNIVYATMWEFRRTPYSFNSGGKGSGIYKSIDAGKTWKKLTKGLPSGDFGRVALTLAPSSPKNLLAIVESENTGLYISADGGENWKQQAATLNVVSRPFYFSTLVIDPIDPKRVYRPAYVFSYSNDGGYSFTDAGGDGVSVHPDHHALWINPQNTNQMYLGTDGGVYMSLDRGNSWLFLNSIPVSQFYHVATDLKSPYNVYGGLQDNGSWMAPSVAPGEVENGDWEVLYGGDGFWVQPSLENENIVFAEYQGGNMVKVNTKTMQSVGIKPFPLSGEEKLRWNWNTPLVASPTNKKTLYTGAQYLYKTQNEGQTWKQISPDLTTNDKNKLKQEESGGLSVDNTSAENHCTIFTIAESPLDENVVWVGTDDGNLQYTTDGGKTWNNVTANYSKTGIPVGTWVSSIEPSRFDKNTVYATFDNHMYGDTKTYIARSNDMGKSWTLFNSSSFKGFAHKLKEDLVSKDLLFAGTEMGLYTSTNGGADWVLFKSKIPEYAMVRDIVIQPQTNDLVLATHGRGVLIIPDISSLRKLSADILEKNVYIFPAKSEEISTSYYNNFPAITYYLKDRINDDVRAEILDKEGNVLQSLPGSKRKGINRIYWNMRVKPPRVASGGAKADFGGFSAPLVMPGDYTVKLMIGKDNYESKITLVNDAQATYTAEDRTLQYKTSMKLFGLMEQLANLNDQVLGVQERIKNTLEKPEAAKNKKVLTEYNNELEKVRATLLATQQKSMFADEERIRENLSEVFAAVVSNEGRPTDSHLQRMEGLKVELEKATEAFQKVQKKYSSKLPEVTAKVEGKK